MNPHSGTPVIQLGQVKNVVIHGCVATPGTEAFLRMDEASAGNISLEGNNLKAAKTAVETVPSNAH
jgi:hypothetical protein